MSGRRPATGSETEAVMRLLSLAHCGPSRIDALVVHFGSAGVAVEALQGHEYPQVDGLRSSKSADLLRAWGRQLRDEGVERIDQQADLGDYLLPSDPDWPARLIHDPQPPPLLFEAGRRPDDQRRHVAIVGTRRCTALGRQLAFEFGEALAGKGMVVVSGLARGIDAAAHQGALAAGGTPLAVVATGLDSPYPKGNTALWESVAEAGAIVTEAVAGTPVDRWRFPARNRIIAGLSDALLVVESAERGGSMHTVDAAIDRDVPVLAVPGPVRGGQSAGTNRLIAESCVPISSVDDLLLAVSDLPIRSAADPMPRSAAGRPRRQAEREPPSSAPSAPTLSQIEASVVTAAAAGAVSVDSLVHTTGFDAASLAGPLVQLELAGIVRRVAGGIELDPRAGLGRSGPSS